MGGDSTTKLFNSFTLLDSNLARPYSTRRYSFKRIFLQTFLRRTNRVEANKRVSRARCWAADASYLASLVRRNLSRADDSLELSFLAVG